MARHVVAAVAEFPPGTRKRIDAGGRPIVVFNVSGEFFALLDRCPHQGASLAAGICTGLVRSSGPGRYEISRPGEMIRCPWHGWEFDIRTGQSWCDPQRLRARAFPVEVRTGSELVAGPYRAEVFPVRVEDDYVVVDA